MKFVLKLTGFVIYCGYFLLVAPLSTWLLLEAQTAVGLLLAASGLLSLVLPVLLILPQRKQNKLLRRARGLIAVLLVVMVTAVFRQTPSGNPDPNSPVQQRYFREEAGYGRFALSNIVPETEQINLGFNLMRYADPLLTVEQSRRVSVFTLDLYREMEKDPDFHELGSAMNLAYDEILGRPFDTGHYYLYVPQNAGPEPLPAIVFLHGSAGNFKAYTWIWSKLAEAEGYVIIAPSYGFGNWDEAGAAMVLQALDDARQQVNIDETQIYLAGLSNGGLGVSQLAQLAPDMFQGLIFLSPVIDTNIVDSVSFQSAWANRPILVISGEADKRIPLAYIEQRVTVMRQASIDVTSKIYSNEDHFLVFSQPQSVMQDVSVWLEAQD